MRTQRTAYFLFICCLVLIMLTACDNDGNPPPRPPNNGNGDTGSSLPDLRIVGADLQKEGLNEGIYSVHVLMENGGTDTSNTFAYGCYWECTAPTGDMHLVEKKQEQGLANGQGPTVATIQGFAIACDPLPSTLRFDCEIDTQDDIEESNENNNVWGGDLGVPIVP